MLEQAHPRPKLSDGDRFFWVLVSRFWSGWRDVLHVVQPDTVMRWHRQGFRHYWRWTSRRRGRPSTDPEIVHLIRRMRRANPLWGAPRIHGELLKLGIEVSETIVAKYMIKRRGPPSQAWRTFLINHAKETIALDFFTVPTATFRVLFGLIVLSHDRRRILHVNATEHARALNIDEVPTAPQSPSQNPSAERVIGSIRRECLDHVIVLGAGHFCRILSSYSDYCNRTRTHLPLSKHSPDKRAIQPPEQGIVKEIEHIGGLQHDHVRSAA